MAFMDKLGRFLEGAVGGFQEGVNLRQGMNREQRAVDAVAENRRRFELGQVQQLGVDDPKGALDETARLADAGIFDPNTVNQATNIVTGKVNRLASQAGIDTAGMDVNLGKQEFTTEKDVATQLSESEEREKALRAALATFPGVGGEDSPSNIERRRLEGLIKKEDEFQAQGASIETAYSNFFKVPQLTGEVDKEGYSIGTNPLNYDQSLEEIRKNLMSIHKGNTEIVENQIRKVIDARNVLDETRFTASVEAMRKLDPSVSGGQIKQLLTKNIHSRNPVVQNALGAVIANASEIDNKEQIADLATVGDAAVVASNLTSLEAGNAYFDSIVANLTNLPSNYNEAQWKDLIKSGHSTKQNKTYKGFIGQVEEMLNSDRNTAATYGPQKSSILQTEARRFAYKNAKMSVLMSKSPLKWTNADKALLAHAMYQESLDAAADAEINAVKDAGQYDATAIIEGIPDMLKNIHGSDINRGRELFFKGDKRARKATELLKTVVIPQARQIFGNDELALSMVNDMLKEAGVKLDFNDPTGVGIVPLEDLEEQEEIRQQQRSQNPRAYVSAEAQSGSTLPPIFPEQVEAP
jgi:flagellar biosynthesis chaperone FliJ